MKDLFGTWNSALKAAGLPVSRFSSPGMNKDEIVEILQKAFKLLGHTPTAVEIDGLHKATGQYISAATVKNHFGSYTNGLLEAGLKPSKFSQHPTDFTEIIEGFRKFKQEFGHNPTKPEWDLFNRSNNYVFVSSTIVVLRFGSWKNALLEAGLIE